MKTKLLFLISMLAYMCNAYCYTTDDFVWDFEWLEPNNTVEVVVGESQKLQYNSSSNYSKVFLSSMSENWVHYDMNVFQQVVAQPTGYSIDEKGYITGLIPGTYAIKPTGLIQVKSGCEKRLTIKVVSERKENESNNTLDTANEIKTKIRFGLYNTSDVDYFRFKATNCKFGDYITFKIHYYGRNDSPFGYKWATFADGQLVGGGSLISQDQECSGMVLNDGYVYLEVYYDQSRSQYFNYGEEFVAEVYVNGIPASELQNKEEDDNDNDEEQDEKPKEFVDLGLPSGLLWATTNVGANKPEEYGDYFAWAETEPKSTYSWNNYDHAKGTQNSLTKYCTSSEYGFVDYKQVLEKDDDAATVNWGEPWYTPTLSNTQELIKYCTWTYSNLNGVNGYYVVGPNGNSIFIPSAGVMQYNFAYMVGVNACIQTSTIFNASNGNPSLASVLYCENGEPHYWYGWSRCWGYPVRAVTKYDPNSIDNTIDDSSNDIIGIYNINGHKLEGTQKGINIIKYKNGKTVKVLK